MSCHDDDDLCINESKRKRRILLAVDIICLIVLVITLLMCFLPLCRGRTAYRGVNGKVKDDKQFNSNLKSTKIL